MVRYIAPILPHVHFRGEEYDSVVPPYAEQGFRDSEAVGALAIIEQPNPKKVLTSVPVIRERREALRNYTRGIQHRVHIGLTTDLEQVREAFRAATEHDEDVYSVKGFWTHSTGMMGLLDPKLQREIWMLAGGRKGIDYRGVFFQHLEDEKAYTGKFDWTNPITHSLRQNENAETISAITQIRNAYDADFRGTFYAAHVSSPTTAEFLNFERPRMPFDIVIETTAHHEFLNTDHYRTEGNKLKMNPPVRDPVSQRRLLEYVIEGKTDILGDDHAPHPISKKDSDNPPSGIPAIAFLPKRIKLLREAGIQEGHLQNLLFWNAKRLFGFRDLKAKEVDIEYRPELWKNYGWNPFAPVDGTAA